MNYRLTSPVTPMQSHRFRQLLVILWAFLSPVTPTPAEIKAQAPIVVAVPGKQIQLSTADWTAMRNEETYAKNFESRHKAKNEVMEQVVTVFLIEMSPDRRIGTKISDTEHVEFFTVHPNSVTVQVRREKKGYWILSRQTFALTTGAPVSGAALKHNYSDADITQLRHWLQNDIDRTRFLLSDTF